MGALIAAGLPWLANALFGPQGVAGAAAEKIGTALGLPDKTVEAVKNAVSGLNPEQVVALKKVENDFALQMKQAGYTHTEQLAKIDLDQITVVNKTIQVELENSDKEAWYQKAWRPANGFAVAIGSLFAVIVLCIAFVLGLFYGKGEMIAQLPVLASSLALILGVPGTAVGIAAWHRGKEKREALQADQGEQ